MVWTFIFIVVLASFAAYISTVYDVDPCEPMEKRVVLCLSNCRDWKVGVRSEVNSELNFSPNFEGLVLGCIDADFCK